MVWLYVYKVKVPVPAKPNKPALLGTSIEIVHPTVIHFEIVIVFINALELFH